MLLHVPLALLGLTLSGQAISRSGASSIAVRQCTPFSPRSDVRMEEAEFSAAQLKAAGFPAARLKNAGFPAAELIEAGYEVPELLLAGYTAAELTAAGAGAAPSTDEDADELRPPDLPPSLLSESAARRLQPIKSLWRKPPAGRKIKDSERGWGDREPQKDQ